jgi:hypothetical protein
VDLVHGDDHADTRGQQLVGLLPLILRKLREPQLVALPGLLLRKVAVGGWASQEVLSDKASVATYNCVSGEGQGSLKVEHTYIHTHIHTNIQTYIHSNIHINAYIAHIYILYTHTYITYIQTYTYRW